MRQFGLFTLIIIFLFSCKKETKTPQNNFKIHGIVTNAPANTYVKLLQRTNNGNKLIDSSLITKSAFELAGRTQSLDFFILEFSKNPYSIFLLVDSADNIKFNANFKNLQLYSVNKSKNSKFIQILENKLFLTNSKLEIEIKNNKDISSDMDRQRKFSKKFIKKHIQSPACIIALSQKFINGEPVLPIENNLDLFKQTEQALRTKYAKKEFFLDFVAFIKNYEVASDRNKRQKQEQRPKKIVDFSAKTISGKNFNLKKYAEKSPVLLSFWASWSPECVINNQVIKKIEQKYPKIKIVLISLDSDPEILKDTLKKYNFKHILINDTLVWNSNIVALYDIEKLPTNILINSKGEIQLFSSDVNELVRNISKLK